MLIVYKGLLLLDIFLLVVLLGKNRDRLGIVAAILEGANSDSCKTRIMFSANLSFALLEKYLHVVVSVGFLQLQNSKYNLTKRGREFLDDYRRFEGRYVKAQKLLESLDCEREPLTRLCARSKSPKSTELITNVGSWDDS